jgi:hypothetical protein
MSQNTLMSQVKHSTRALSTPDLAMWRVMFWMDCAVAEARPEDVGDQALMRGLDTACPFVRPRLPRSRCGRRSRGSAT